MRSAFATLFGAVFILIAAESRILAQAVLMDKGHLLEITLKADKDRILLNEPIFLSFEIKNYSAEDLCVGEGGDYRNNSGRPDSFKVTVTGDDGRSVPQPEVTDWRGGFIGCGPIPQGESHVTKLFLPHWATFETAGSYKIVVRKSLGISNRKDKPSVVQADVSVNIKVLPKDDAALGEVIDSLGRTMLQGEKPEAISAGDCLRYIDDKRVIKYLAKAIEKYGTDEVWPPENIGQRALSALARFNDDSALSILEKWMTSQTEETRYTVANALLDSKHPRASELLLRMQDDDYWFVRLRVAQGASKLPPFEGRLLLRKLANDPNADVQKAAREFLAKESAPLR